MKQTITFKNGDRSGRFACFQRRTSEIKLNKKKIGWLTENDAREIEVWLHLRVTPSKEAPAAFRNARLKVRYENFEEAKAALKANFPELAKKLDIFQHED